MHPKSMILKLYYTTMHFDFEWPIVSLLMALPHFYCAQNLSRDPLSHPKKNWREKIFHHRLMIFSKKVRLQKFRKNPTFSDFFSQKNLKMNFFFCDPDFLLA